MRKKKHISESLMNPGKITFILSPTLFSFHYPKKRKQRCKQQNDLYIWPNMGIGL